MIRALTAAQMLGSFSVQPLHFPHPAPCFHLELHEFHPVKAFSLHTLQSHQDSEGCQDLCCQDSGQALLASRCLADSNRLVAEHFLHLY